VRRFLSGNNISKTLGKYVLSAYNIGKRKGNEAARLDKEIGGGRV
jgi:hypothetical protein